MALRLTDGTTIGGLSRPRQGMRHRVLFGVEASTGREVAVKIELIPGALEPERRALEWLALKDGPAPRLQAAGTLDDSGEFPGAACLVTHRVGGEAPRSVGAWERLGRALARLARIPWTGSELTALDHDAFVDLHERRVEDLTRALGRDLAQSLPSVPPSYSASPMVVTHGGPGNFLDHGAAGTLIDWEDAQVAPRGLDLGRAIFIALLGAGPEGHVARDHAAGAEAVTVGFLAEADPPARPDRGGLVDQRRRRPVRPPPPGTRRGARRPSLA
jgi:hypothetical protein